MKIKAYYPGSDLQDGKEERGRREIEERGRSEKENLGGSKVKWRSLSGRKELQELLHILRKGELPWGEETADARKWQDPRAM